jgi:hypothetical protein
MNGKSLIFLPQLKNFEPVDVNKLEDSLFKKRYEIKYLFSPNLLSSVLNRLTDSYRILNINNHFLQDYESLYFDTQGFRFYLDHQNGKLNRYKVRYRKYPGSDLIFVELKFKNNKSQTKKWRKKINKSRYHKGVITEQETRFINNFCHYEPGDLTSRFTVVYSRLALIHKRETERVTIDLDLSYAGGCEDKNFKNISIAEVKQETLSHNSSFSRVMREFRVPPVRFSKYCFGIYQFYPVLKYNRFKPRYIYFERNYRAGIS